MELLTCSSLKDRGEFGHGVRGGGRRGWVVVVGEGGGGRGGGGGVGVMSWDIYGKGNNTCP